RDAVAPHLREPAPAVRRELLVRRRAGRVDRREDAAARGKDVEIAGAALAQAQLALARAREQQVGVWVDEAGCDGATGGIEPGEAGHRIALRLERPRRGSARADGEDRALPARDDRCIAPA